jgi:hypothetical protein
LKPEEQNTAPLGGRLATAVERVEALTIVLAIGVTRGCAPPGGRGSCTRRARDRPGGRRSGGQSSTTDTIALGWGPAPDIRSAMDPQSHSSLQWLQGVARRGRDLGLASANQAPRGESFDSYPFTTALKGVFLEGLKVVFIVLTFGATQHRIALLGRFHSGRLLDGRARRSCGLRSDRVCNPPRAKLVLGLARGGDRPHRGVSSSCQSGDDDRATRNDSKISSWPSDHLERSDRRTRRRCQHRTATTTRASAAATYPA